MEPFADSTYFKENEFIAPAGTSDDKLDRNLARASRTVRAEIAGIDDRIARKELDPDTVADVVCEMAESALASGNGPGLESVQQGAGPFQKTLKFANPRGDMFLTAKHRRMLTAKKARRAFTVQVKGPGDVR